jgi:seryl-tRNA synthetase
MISIDHIRRDRDDVKRRMARRGIGLVGAEVYIREIEKVDEDVRKHQTRQQTGLAERNALTKDMNTLRKEGASEAILDAVKAQVQGFKPKIQSAEAMANAAHDRLRNILLTHLNLLDDSVPNGLNEHGNVVQRVVGVPVQLPAAKNHIQLGKALEMMDFEQTSKYAGAGFVTLKGRLARLERALSAYMIDTLEGFGFEEHSVPALVKSHALIGTGQLPKFAEDLYGVDHTFHWDQDDPPPEHEFSNRYLIPTGEVPLTNMVRESILDDDHLPMYMSALTPCFRREAGSSGVAVRGMIRLHQFQKVEMVAITRPEESDEVHEQLVYAAETMLKNLGLCYRVVLLCAGDTGATSRKTYDLEVWLPSENGYREISSISNCGDFQARRMDARFKKRGTKGTEFVHTLNGSGLAVGRTLVAIMENYQTEDGRITVPLVLQKYMGTDIIK